jgi:hypothetical protein
MSHTLDAAVAEAYKVDPSGCSFLPEEACPWPLYITLSGSNITLRDALPSAVKEGHGPQNLDLTSPNPFLKSLNTYVEQPQVSK